MTTEVWPMAALICLTMKDMLIHANSGIRKFEMLWAWRGWQKQNCGYMDVVCVWVCQSGKFLAEREEDLAHFNVRLKSVTPQSLWIREKRCKDTEKHREVKACQLEGHWARNSTVTTWILFFLHFLRDLLSHVWSTFTHLRTNQY